MAERRTAERRTAEEMVAVVTEAARRWAWGGRGLRLQDVGDAVGEALRDLTEGRAAGAPDEPAGWVAAARRACDRLSKRETRGRRRWAPLPAPEDVAPGKLRQEARCAPEADAGLAVEERLGRTLATAALLGAFARTPALRELDTALAVAAGAGGVDGTEWAFRLVADIHASFATMPPPGWFRLPLTKQLVDRLAARRSRLRGLLSAVSEGSETSCLAETWPGPGQRAASRARAYRAAANGHARKSATARALIAAGRLLAAREWADGVAAVAFRVFDHGEPWANVAPLVAELTRPYGAPRRAFAVLAALAGHVRDPRFRALRASAQAQPGLLAQVVLAGAAGGPAGAGALAPATAALMETDDGRWFVELARRVRLAGADVSGQAAAVLPGREESPRTEGARP
jgi:hypothetical protein